MNLGAVILAAGYSSRMGGFKPLMRLGGDSLVGHCLRLFAAAGVGRTVVVTGHRREEVEAELIRLGGEPLHNPEFARGMFSSVQAAVEQMSGLDGFFMLPVDIPLVRPATLDLLMEAFDATAVVYPCRHGVRGHPPLIPARLIPAIREHDGSDGLKRLLEDFPGRDVQVWDDGVLMDADTPEDFTRLVDRAAHLESGSRAEAESLAAMLMPERGVVHGRMVADIARALAEELNRNGYHLDLDVVHNAALLHDVAKGQPEHETRGAEMMRRLGLNRLAEPVGAHRDALPVPPEALGEKELVCLADKLVRGRWRMPVRQRFSEKLAVYADDPAAILAIQARMDNALALQRAVETATSRTVEDILGAGSKG